MDREKFIGAWKLISVEVRYAEGNVISLYGENPAGMLLYAPGGQVSVHLMDRSRPAFSGKDKSLGTPEETKAAVTGYEAYFGTFEVHEDSQSIVHHVEGSLFPNWIGSDQLRFYEFCDGRLILTTPPIPYSGTTLVGALTWEPY